MGILEVVGGALGVYKIVSPSEAHVRIMSGKKQVFMCRSKSKAGPHDGELVPDNEEYKSAYWIIPFVTKITKLPLVNLRIDAPDVKLNDINMARFSADIVVFVNIDNPLLAAERTDLTVTATRYEGMESISSDFKAIIQSVMRTVATKQTVRDIFMDRGKLDVAISQEIQGVFPGWGLRLVDLEINDIKDTPDSTIIQDIERQNAAVINADARSKVAIENKRAEIAEATNKKEAEVVKAENEETWRKRQILKDQEVGIAEQLRVKMTADQQAQANISAIEARRKLEVGGAEVEKQATIQRAEGVKQKTSLEAEGEANRINATGTANAEITRKTLVAQAEGTEKLAKAQQLYNDAATNIEIIKANKEVGLALAGAYTQIGKNAHINIVSGSSETALSGGLLGNVKLGPKEGAALQQFVDTNPEMAKQLADKLFGNLAPASKEAGAKAREGSNLR